MGLVTFTAPTNWGALAGSTLTGGIINGFDTAIGSSTGNNGVGFDQDQFLCPVPR
jgi:hypothetical protein